MDYVLHKGEIHQVGPVTAANEIKRNDVEDREVKKQETTVPQHT